MSKQKKTSVEGDDLPVPDAEVSPAKDQDHTLELTEKTTSEDVSSIISLLLENRRKNLIIDAGKVERIDTPFFEVMVATSKLWQSDGYSMDIVNASEAFENSLELLGIPFPNLEARGQ